jgi:hypothetical protein
MDTSLTLLLLLAPFFYLMFSLEKYRKSSFWDNRNTYCCTFVCSICLFFLQINQHQTIKFNYLIGFKSATLK